MLARIIYCLMFVCSFCTAGAQTGKARLLELVALVSHDFDANSDSIDYHADMAVKLARQLGDMDAEMKVQRFRATRIHLHGQSDKATKLLLDVAREAEKHPPTLESAQMYYLLAQIYSKNNYMPIAENYLRKGLDIAIALKNDISIADGYNRLGIQYERRSDLDSALYCYEQALRYNNQGQELIGLAYSLENIAGIYVRKKQQARALTYQKQALTYKLKTGRKVDLAMAYINIGETYDSLKNNDSSILYIQKAIAMARAINYKDLESYGYQYLSRISEKMGDLGKALKYHKQYVALNDTIYNEAKAKQLAELNTKYQVEKNEQQIKELSHRSTIQQLQLKQRNTLLFIAVILFLALGIIAYLAYNRRKLKAMATLQAEINRQQAITTREVFIAEEKERKRIAADLHDGVGQLLSATLLNLNSFFKDKDINKQSDRQAGQIVSLVTESYDELRALSHQMMPMALLRSGFAAAVKEMLSKIDENKLAVSLEINGIDGHMSEDIETVLYRVIQECLNNVIKHAEATAVTVQIDKDDQEISVTIEDNGKGFDINKLKQQGIGMKNIYSRVSLINGTVDIDSSPGKGTFVAIHVPL